MKANSFALCLASPVVHKMVCGGFREGLSKEIVLEDVDKLLFEMALALCICGKDVEVGSMAEAVELGKLADLLQMQEVRSATEEMILKTLTVDTCAEVLSASLCSGLSMVEERSRALALERFEEIAKTAGFLRLNEEVLESLLEDDMLVAAGEEEVLGAAMRWMKADEGGARGEGVLRTIRFGLMTEEHLAKAADEATDEDFLLIALVREARLIKADGGRMREVTHLSQKALQSRKGRVLRWAQCAEKGGRRLYGHTNGVHALAACGLRMCSGSYDGTVRGWGRLSLETECVFGEHGGSPVWSLAFWEGRLVSGHNNGRLRIWDVDTGRLEQELEGHTGSVYALTVCGDRLVSGSGDQVIKVWRQDGGGICVRERKLRGHSGSVRCLAVWEGRVISGSDDTTIQVRDVLREALAVTLVGHSASLSALAVGGRRLLSAAWDRTIRAWGLGTWEPLQTVHVYPSGSQQYVQCLAVRGDVLVSASYSLHESASGEVRLWTVETLECQLTFRQAGGYDIISLAVAAEAGEVWGGMGSEVVVWGHE